LAYLVGALLAFAVGGLGTIVRLDRDRAFYPTVMVVVAWALVEKAITRL
jgi:hypothetical protein